MRRAAIVGGLVLARAGPGVLALEGCVRRVDVLGPRHVAPCLRSTCAEVTLGRRGVLAIVGRKGTGRGGRRIGP